MTNFRVTFDEVARLLYFKDTAEVGETQVIVKFPDGITVDYGRTLNVANDWLLGVLSRQDLAGKLMQGEYEFTVKRYNVGGTVLNGTDTGTFTLAYSNVTPSVTESIDLFTPRIALSDDTDYGRLGLEWSISTVLRIWRADNGFTNTWSSVQPSVVLINGGTWSGNYAWTFEYNAGYDHSNGWVVLKNKSNASGSFAVKKPPMLPEISALLLCLYNKIEACCDNAQKDEMLADYVLANSIMHSFVLAGQASTVGGNTLDSATMLLMLNGSECKPGILSILKKWGCADDGTIAETAISAYDFCLCSSPSVPPTGDTYIEPMYHDAGNGCIIRTDGYTDPDANWQFLNTFGTGRFILGPNQVDRVKIHGGRVFGDASISTYNSNGATDSFLLKIPFITYDGSNDVIINEYQVPEKVIVNMPQVWAKSGDFPTENAPWVLDAGSVQVRFVELGQSGVLSYVFAGIGATYPNGWMITFTTP